MKHAVSALALLVVLTGCSSGPFRSRSATTPAQPDTVETLKARVVELQRQAAIHEVEIGRLRQAVASLEARLGGAPPRPAAPAAPPPPPASADDGTGAVRRPAAMEVEDLAPAAPSAPAVPVPPVPSDARVSGDAQVLYDQAYAAYQERRYPEAEAFFTRFLGSFGNTDLADNAQYWIGESRYARGDHAGALAAFRETLARYPDGNKIADALLKSADCLAVLGDAPAARLAYQEVIRRYPGTPAATTAEERRGRLP